MGNEEKEKKDKEKDHDEKPPHSLVATYPDL